VTGRVGDDIKKHRSVICILKLSLWTT